MNVATFLAFVLVLIGPASAAVIHAWRQGSIFINQREIVHAYSRNGVGLRKWVAALLDCWFCLAHWVPGALLSLLIVAGLIWSPLRPWCLLPLIALTATRFIIVINGLLPWRMRHENDDNEAMRETAAAAYAEWHHPSQPESPA